MLQYKQQNHGKVSEERDSFYLKQHKNIQPHAIQNLYDFLFVWNIYIYIYICIYLELKCFLFHKSPFKSLESDFICTFMKLILLFSKDALIDQNW